MYMYLCKYVVERQITGNEYNEKNTLYTSFECRTNLSCCFIEHVFSAQDTKVISVLVFQDTSREYWMDHQ